MNGLTDRQLEVLRFIARQIDEAGYPPTIREIGEALDIRSTNGVNDHLKALERKGYLTRDPVKSRALIPTSAAREALGEPPATVIPFRPGVPKPGSHLVEVPIVGRVAAGQPILAEENMSGSLDMADMFGETSNLFALQVRGDSMIDAGILEGDYVIVRKQDEARAGEIVVALLEDEATVKYYQPRRGHIELIAANTKYEPIVVGKEDPFRVLGTVRGVVRTVHR